MIHSSMTQDVSAKNGVTLYVNCSSSSKLNVRRYPNISSTILKQLARNETVAWYGYYTTDKQWYYIRCKDGTQGYVSSEYLSKNNLNEDINNDSSTNDSSMTQDVYSSMTQDVSAKNGVTLYVNCSSSSKLNVRRYPNTSSTILKQLVRNETVAWYGWKTKDNLWYYVRCLNGTVGYISSQYLSKTRV